MKKFSPLFSMGQWLGKGADVDVCRKLGSRISYGKYPGRGLQW